MPPGTVGAARGSLCLPLSQQLREHRALKWHSLLSELREILNKSSKQLSRVIKSHLKELENPGGTEEFFSLLLQEAERKVLLLKLRFIFYMGKEF